MNKVILIGNLTRAPESGKTANGTQYSRFTLAVNRDYKDEKGKKPTDFISIICWSALAELAYKYLDKGKKVSIIGQLRPSTYEKDGQKISTYDVVADEMEFLSNANKTQPEPQN